MGHVSDIINRANFFLKIGPGVGVTGPRKMAFPVENVTVAGLQQCRHYHASL